MFDLELDKLADALAERLDGRIRATIQKELGHSDPATTRRYLAAQDHNSPRRREQINAAAALVDTILEVGVKPIIQ